MANLLRPNRLESRQNLTSFFLVSKSSQSPAVVNQNSWILGCQLYSATQDRYCLLCLLTKKIGLAKLVERAHVVGLLLQDKLQILDRFRSPAFLVMKHRTRKAGRQQIGLVLQGLRQVPECLLTLTGHFGKGELIQPVDILWIFLNIPLQVSNPILHCATSDQSKTAFAPRFVVVGFQLEVLVVGNRGVSVKPQFLRALCQEQWDVCSLRTKPLCLDQ